MIESNDPSLEGGPLNRLESDPTPRQIESRAREVRNLGFYSHEGEAVVWNPAWDGDKYHVRRQHVPGEARRHLDEADGSTVEVQRHSMREFIETAADKRMALYEWN